jgi:hypothetical protein
MCVAVRASILQKGGDKEATAKDMMEGLEKNVRRMLSTKQKEYDRIVYDLKHRKMELEKLKLDYKDVTIDKSALGIPADNAPPKDRLQVVKTVFTTPFFTRDEVRRPHCIRFCQCGVTADLQFVVTVVNVLRT